MNSPEAPKGPAQPGSAAAHLLTASWCALAGRARAFAAEVAEVVDGAHGKLTREAKRFDGAATELGIVGDGDGARKHLPFCQTELGQRRELSATDREPRR